MRESCLPKTNEQTWLDIANNFEKGMNFPHCIGATDVKHISIIKPSCSGPLHYSYQNYFSGRDADHSPPSSVEVKYE
jgi:hypothetical protein